MKTCGFLICLQIFIACVLSRKVVMPPYIKPCSVSSPDFEKCCLEHGKEALPHIIKGDKKIGLPNMLPLIIPEVNVNAGNNLKISLKDLHVFGLDNTELKQVKIDVAHKKITLKIEIPQLELIGKYDIDGRILVLPIKGNGDANLTATGGKYTYNLEYGLEKKDGVEYLQLTDKDNLDFDLQGVKIYLDNLFGGDKKLGEHMNNFLNEHWKEVLSEFGLTISETVRSVGKSIASAYFRKIPYHDLILD